MEKRNTKCTKKYKEKEYQENRTLEPRFVMNKKRRLRTGLIAFDYKYDLRLILPSGQQNLAMLSMWLWL